MKTGFVLVAKRRTDQRTRFHHDSESNDDCDNNHTVSLASKMPIDFTAYRPILTTDKSPAFCLEAVLDSGYMIFFADDFARAQKRNK